MLLEDICQPEWTLPSRAEPCSFLLLGLAACRRPSRGRRAHGDSGTHHIQEVAVTLRAVTSFGNKIVIADDAEPQRRRSVRQQ
jgi:hypothetical protein